jgi:quinol monooxygenase YgiN
MFVVAAYWRAKEGEGDACAEILRTMSRLSVANEPGCRMFVVHRAVEDPRDFFMYEQYDDEDAFKAHAQTEYFKQHVLGDAVPRLEQRTRTFYTLLD